MNTSIEPKSALIGLLLGILGAVAIGAATSPGQQARYQVAGAGNHAVILDTTTGQAWSTFLSAAGGRTDGNFYQPKLDAKR